MSIYRFDEDFDGFLEDFAPVHDATPIPELVISTYKQRLPERLFTYWRGVGACGFAHGLFWMTDPNEYQDLLDDWLEGTPFEERKDLSVIGRTAFGILKIWAKNKGNVMNIDPHDCVIFYFPKNDKRTMSNEEENIKIQYYFGAKSPRSFDMDDASEKPLFERALKKLGRLKPEQMYGFSHSPMLGGKETLSNLDIVDLDIYHHIARQMQAPEVIQIET
jgi:hypothetical protein